jgi:hypothetical protein
MKAMTRSLTILATLGLLLAVSGLLPSRAGDDQAKEKASSIWMKEKLGASQNILAGLTKADYDAIEKNAQTMRFVGYLEKWVRADTPGYRNMVTDFEHANQALITTARRKNLDGATIAYVQLTLSCVNCHKLVRDVTK